ncbi:3-phosphoglycerate dehydrogenase [Paracoccus sediminis]|uniref:3-phosphoglycerate dehydrogenase n=1 Tax=Paracoccus sediminis TaxID=1214787 RepID=A0A238X4J2_9RHOB|nr:2-hydroxyacid dehydrogenase [Paracoccus sediminis]TBN49264.1 3-phosphoglycerate dehydrogenase [Paracoccus sediminis]SNR53274.1 D-3-phosphoglycerate dehydrogenase [Paracoccus sediminis]
MTRIVLLDPASPERLDRIRPLLPDGWTLTTAGSRDPQDQIAALRGASFAITGDVPVTGAMMAMPGLKAVHKWGVGYDGIDLDAARSHGVRVFRTTGSNAVAVAETTLGLILAVNRNIVRGHVGIRDGGWPKGQVAPSSATLSGRRVGIVGMGHVGRALARLLRGFGCDLLYSKRTPLPTDQEDGARFVPLDDLLAAADVVTLNCDLNDSTRDLIGRDQLALMKPDAILINAARGGVLVESDLADAIRAGRLRGAGIDVFSVEPILRDNPLLGLDRVVLTPHLGALDAGAFAPTIARMIGNLMAVQSGMPPRESDVLV